MNRFLKITALALCMSIPVQSVQQSRSTKAMIAGATVVAVGAAVCISYRESNHVKIVRARQLMDAYRGQIEQSLGLFNDDRSMDLVVRNPGMFKIEIVKLQDSLSVIYEELLARYNSWITPWNWTKEVQSTCAQIEQFLLQTKLVFLLLAAQQSQKTMDSYVTVVDEVLASLTDEQQVYQVLKQSGPLKKDLRALLPVIKECECELQQRSFVNKISFAGLYKIEKIERALRDFSQKTWLLITLLRYTPCFAPDMSEYDLAKAVRMINGKESSYPIMHMVNELDKDIQRINALTIYVSCEQLCLQMLEQVRMELLASQQHAAECQSYEIYLQQQRLAKAAEEQARAAQDQARAAESQAAAQREQAWALSRQAAAIEERNRLERNKKK